MNNNTQKERVLSGIQPSGRLHLGNYLGAIRKFTGLQDRYACFFCVVDMHAITVWQDPGELREKTFQVVAGYLAAGVDPGRAAVFHQSAVRAHAELAWILNCTARLGWLDRMTQFKDKTGKNSERASAGLYTYPVLQAADILAYKATRVPAGEDQKQHLELARDIAEKFNHDYGVKNFFPLPHPLIEGPGARVMSLRNGTEKMSKSGTSENTCIFLDDDSDTIVTKIRKARTDSGLLPFEPAGLDGRPEAANLVGIHAALSGKSTGSVLEEFGGKGFGVFKPALAELVVETIAPVCADIKRLMNDRAYLLQVMASGAERAGGVTEPVIRDVKDIVGFVNTDRKMPS